MNLIVQKIQELNKAIKDLQIKKITPEELHAIVAAANAVHKWTSSAIQIYSMTTKRELRKELNKMNIIDDDTVVAIDTLAENDYVKCYEKDNALIQRSECLDYSESHYPECGGCPSFVSTRRAILGLPGK